MRYRLNTPTVISEIIDGEVIVIHLGTGKYYSILNSAAYIWEALSVGHTVEQVADQLSLVAQEHVQDTVRQFVDLLLAESLLMPTDEPVKGETPLATPQSYAPPILHIYEDMQDILLLDPIHQVDEAGWPKAASNDDNPNLLP